VSATNHASIAGWMCMSLLEDPISGGGHDLDLPGVSGCTNQNVTSASHQLNKVDTDTVQIVSKIPAQLSALDDSVDLVVVAWIRTLSVRIDNAAPHSEFYGWVVGSLPIPATK
jgi:hypothetical protein